MSEDSKDRRRDFDQDPQVSLIVNILRITFLVLLFVVVAVGILTDSGDKDGQQLFANWWAALTGALFFFLAIVALDLLTPKHKLSTISAIFFGLLAGILATLLFSFVINLFVETYIDQANRGKFAVVVLTFQIALGLGMCYLGISTVLQTRSDFRLIIPYVEFTKQYRGARPFLLDTSALIDGRILDVAEVGVLQCPIVIPRFVIAELQVLSDSSDRLKRARGRRGLEMVSTLQKTARLDVTIDESDVAGKDVDQRLVELAREMPASIVTLDMGLNRVAVIHGVNVVNINDLANAMKPNALPGESLEIELIRRGEQHGQAVGYLEDGTMVVAENGEPAIGTRTTLTVTSTMQTSAGRLIFGRLSDDAIASIAGGGNGEPNAGGSGREEDESGSPAKRRERSQTDHPPARTSSRNPRRN